jgi:hypothetical protein
VVGGRIDIGAVEAQPNPLPGDGDFDGVVDDGDHDVWASGFGDSDDLRGDFNYDGAVDAADFVVWRKNLGQSLPATAASGDASAALAQPVAPEQALAEPVARVRSPETRAQQSRGQETRAQQLRGQETRAQLWNPETRALRAMFEASPSPARLNSPQASLRGRGTERALELRVADERDGALAAWLAMRGRADGAANDDVIEALRYLRDEAGRESTFHDVFDEVFASRKFLATL